MLIGQRNEIKLQGLGCGAYAESGIGQTTGDCYPDGHVSKLFPLVAMNGSGIKSQSFELVIEQNSRSRPRLPIDKPAILTGEIVQTVNRFRIAGPHQDTLLSLRQMNQDNW